MAPVNPNGIPAALKDEPCWVCWAYVRKDRWSKIPINAATRRRAKSNDPATWTTFDLAMKRAMDDRTLGVGFVFTADNGICGVDLDDAVDPATGRLYPWAAQIVPSLDTYTEWSPSGTGVKLYLYGRKPKGAGCGRDWDGEDRGLRLGPFFCHNGQPLFRNAEHR